MPSLKSLSMTSRTFFLPTTGRRGLLHWWWVEVSQSFFVISFEEKEKCPRKGKKFPEFLWVIMFTPPKATAVIHLLHRSSYSLSVCVCVWLPLFEEEEWGWAALATRREVAIPGFHPTIKNAVKFSLVVMSFPKASIYFPFFFSSSFSLSSTHLAPTRWITSSLTFPPSSFFFLSLVRYPRFLEAKVALSISTNDGRFK